MKTIFIFLVICFCGSSYISAQQLPLFSQYRESQSILNPAAVSIDFIRNRNNLSLGASYRNQWDQTKLQLDNGETQAFGPMTTTIRAEWVIPEKRFFVGGAFHE